MKQRADPLADAVSAKYELACQVLRSFGSLRFAATGWSMLPQIWSGDTLVVERVTPDQIQLGDIALVGRNGRLCAHRVVSLPEGSGNRFWITQGDAMPTPDWPVTESELLGRVPALIRSGRCMALPANLSAIERLLRHIVRRSVFAARVFIYLTGKVRTHKGSALWCQG